MLCSPLRWPPQPVVRILLCPSTLSCSRFGLLSRSPSPSPSPSHFPSLFLIPFRRSSFRCCRTRHAKPCKRLDASGEIDPARTLGLVRRGFGGCAATASRRGVSTGACAPLCPASPKRPSQKSRCSSLSHLALPASTLNGLILKRLNLLAKNFKPPMGQELTEVGRVAQWVGRQTNADQET